MQLRDLENCRRRNAPPLLARPALGDDATLAPRVAAIIAQVRAEGDAALRELTAKFDRVELAALEVGPKEFAAAGSSAHARRNARRFARPPTNIETFHRPQLPQRVRRRHGAGRALRARRSRRSRASGCTCPPAARRCPRRRSCSACPRASPAARREILCSPVQATGRVDAAVLYAARVAGVQRVFKLGGAQAIAAMAYGTESVPKVDKIFGPGNAWVTEAKAQVDRDPAGAARDYPAGPSEVLVIADDERQRGVRRRGPAVAGRARRRFAGAAA